MKGANCFPYINVWTSHPLKTYSKMCLSYSVCLNTETSWEFSAIQTPSESWEYNNFSICSIIWFLIFPEAVD